MPLIFNIALAIAALLLLIGVVSSRISSRLNLPILLMFLLTGIVFGSDGLGYINLSAAGPETGLFINALGSIAIAFILYSGGLETNYGKIKGVLLPGTILATWGVLLTAILLGLGSAYLLHWPLEWGLLLGCVISSTDAAAVFGILRSRSVALRSDLQSLLELESGSNDPMAALLTIFMVDLIANDQIANFQNLKFFLLMFLLKMSLGILGGYCWGRLGCWLFNRVKPEYEGLYFVLGISIVLLTYSVTECCYGNGFMAVYVAGLVMGRRRYHFKKGQLRLNNGVAWLMQVILFTVLGMLLSPKELLQTGAQQWYDTLAVKGIFLALFLMLIARPVAIFLSLIRSKNFHFREKLVISWAGLRGAAPIVLATFPLAMEKSAEETARAMQLFNLVFFMVFASVFLQGWTLMPLARALGLSRKLGDSERMPLELEETGVWNSVTREFEVTENSLCIHCSLAEIQLPEGTLVLLLRRNNHFLLARGNTRLEAGDVLLILGEAPLLQEIAQRYFPEATEPDELDEKSDHFAPSIALTTPQEGVKRLRNFFFHYFSH